MKRVLGIILLVGVLAGGGWWFWTTTPAYAVQQASNAVKTHDVDVFHHWVDVHNVASSAVEDLLAEPVRSTGTGLLERVIGLSIVNFFRPALVDSMSQQIDKWVAHKPKPKNTSYLHLMQPARAASDDQDDEDDQEEQPKSFLGALVHLVKPPSLKEIFREYGLTKKNFRGLGDMDQSSHLAHVGLKFYSPKIQQEYQIKLELNDTPGHWQISRISNLQQVVGTLCQG